MFNRTIGTSLLLILLLVLLAGRAEALGLGVSPHRLELEAYPLGSVTGAFNVTNPSEERCRYQAYVEGEYQEWLTLTPEEFVLDPQDSQEVKVAVSPPIIASGEHNTHISIVALQAASELKVGTGVKLPVHVRMVAPPPLAMIGINLTGIPLFAFGGAVLLLLTALISGTVIWVRRRGHAV